MKIIFNTLSLSMGGAEKLAIEYVKKLAEDFEVLLLIRENNYENNDLEEQIPKNVKYIYVIDDCISRKLNKYRKLKKKNFIYKLLYNYYLKQRRQSYRINIVKKIKQENYDILIDFASKLPYELYDNRTIIWQQTDIKEEDFNKELIENFTLKLSKIKKLVVLTEELKNKIIRYIDVENISNKIEVIYNFFNIENIKKMAKDNNKLSEDEKEIIGKDFILACSMLNKNKSLDILILSFNLIKNKVKENLYIIGEGKERKNLENLIKKLNLEERVILLGIQKNPYIWMKNANLFVHSSKSEAFGMVLVEALVNKCIIVSTDCPTGPREILEYGKYGILTEVDNIKEMADNMLLALSDSKVRELFLNRAEERAYFFSQNRVYNKFKKSLFEIGGNNEK